MFLRPCILVVVVIILLHVISSMYRRFSFNSSSSFFHTMTWRGLVRLVIRNNNTVVVQFTYRYKRRRTNITKIIGSEIVFAKLNHRFPYSNFPTYSSYGNSAGGGKIEEAQSSKRKLPSSPSHSAVNNSAGWGGWAKAKLLKKE